MRILLTVLCMALSACAHGSLPGDVTRFIEQRDACEHFRGEFPDPPDPGRVKELVKMVAENCTGTDTRLAELRARYQANAAVIERDRKSVV